MPFMGAQKRSNEASAEKRCLDWRNTGGDTATEMF